MYELAGWLGSPDKTFGQILGTLNFESASDVFKGASLMAAIAYSEWRVDLLRVSDGKVLLTDSNIPF